MYDFKNVFYFHATLSPKGFVTETGGKIFQETEIEKESIAGQYFPKIFFWQHNENIAENIEHSINAAGGGKSLEFETSLQVNPTRTATVKVKFTPLLNEQNEVEKIIFSSTDVSEYIREIDFHKKRSERFLFAAECAEVGLWFWDLQTQDIFTTPRCNQIFGLLPDEIMTYEKFMKVVYPEDMPKLEEALNKSQTNLTDYIVEYRVEAEPGRMSWISVRGKTFSEENNSLLMMGSARDITHRKLSDERLKKLYEVEKTIRDQVQEANLQKDHFLAIVSHELRSPLQTILGWTKILLSQEIDANTQQKALETIENSAKLQAKIISDLVDSAKIISGKLDFSISTLSLHKLVSAVYQSQKPLAEEKNISFVLGEVEKLQIVGDAGRLQQAITNLVSNAVKFTPPDGVILIQLREENNRGILSVTDSGPGIPPDELPLIFRQYFQSKSAQNKTGLGLGLSIVKAIVDKHGGEITVRNNENGVGCTFFLSLPVYKTDDATNPRTPSKLTAAHSPLKDIRILIVEDNQDSREVLHYYLSQMGANIFSAASSEEGLAYLNSTATPPDVIISDISMPVEDGYTFIKKVRNSTDNGDSIPAIALTAFASNNDEKKVLEAGFQKYHTKPFEPEVLISDVLEVVSQK
jgi:PAS domain S-box-containing protein